MIELSHCGGVRIYIHMMKCKYMDESWQHKSVPRGLPGCLETMSNFIKKFTYFFFFLLETLCSLNPDYIPATAP